MWQRQNACMWGRNQVAASHYMWQGYSLHDGQLSFMALRWQHLNCLKHSSSVLVCMSDGEVPCMCEENSVV